MARERTTFGSHENTAHTWAQQTVAGYGRSSDGRINFNGDTIYSYGSHFPVARFVERKGARFVLFTTRSYSSSTGKHKSIIARALNGLAVPVFNVEDVTATPDAGCVKALQAGIVDTIAKFTKSFPWDVNEELGRIRGKIDDANKMLAFFGIRQRVRLPAISDETLATLKVRAAKKMAASKARAEARRVAADAHNRRTLAEYREGGHHELRACDWGVASTFTATDHTSHDSAYEVIQTDKAAAWRAGKPVQWCWNESPTTMLRVHGDVVQTSRGAEFPADHARRAFPIVARCRTNGSTWERNGHTVHLGHYQLDSIAANGDVRAGCHTVPWSEIEQAARALGILEA